MGLESSLFTPEKSPYNQAALRSFLGSRLGAPKKREKTPDVFQLSNPQNAQSFNGMGGNLNNIAPAPAAAGRPSAAASLFGSTSPTPTPTPTGQGANLAPTSFQSELYDPVIAQISAARTADLATAENDALAGRRSALSEFGDRGLAEKELGAGDPTLASISADPDASQSTLARIARSYRSAVKDNEDALNEANLFYGGYRGTRLKDLSQQRTSQEADASKALQDTLHAIGAALLEKKNSARDQSLAEREAAFRDRLARGIPGNGTGGGGPQGTIFGDDSALNDTSGSTPGEPQHQPGDRWFDQWGNEHVIDANGNESVIGHGGEAARIQGAPLDRRTILGGRL